MKLLFDENLAPSLVEALADIYPQSVHVRELGLKCTPDLILWEYAARMGYTMVSKDADFRQRSFLYGPPPKVIWIRLGNCSTKQIAELFRKRRSQIDEFGAAEEQAFLGLA